MKRMAPVDAHRDMLLSGARGALGAESNPPKSAAMLRPPPPPPTPEGEPVEEAGPLLHGSTRGDALPPGSSEPCLEDEAPEPAAASSWPWSNEPRRGVEAGELSELLFWAVEADSRLLAFIERNRARTGWGRGITCLASQLRSPPPTGESEEPGWPPEWGGGPSGGGFRGSEGPLSREEEADVPPPPPPPRCGRAPAAVATGAWWRTIRALATTAEPPLAPPTT